MTKVQAKRKLLHSLATILDGDDSLFPEDLDDASRAYDAWDAAREELSTEFRRRSAGKAPVEP